MWKKIKKTLFTAKEDEAAPPPAKEEAPYYRSDRFFYQSSLVNKSGSGKKDGWYFLVRGGESHGPYKDRDAAQIALDEIIAEFKESGITGRD